MMTIVKDFLLSVTAPERPQLSETDRLIAEIEAAKNKIQYAWNHFEYAAPEYVELAVLELLLAETHYSLLNKRYRIMLGINKPPFSLDGHLHHHAFYGALFNASPHLSHKA